MLGTDFKRVVEQVSRDKGINRDVLIQALEEALKSAARKKYGNNIDVESQYNAELGEIEVFQFREVAVEVLEPEIEIAYEDARLLDPECEIGDSLGKKMDTTTFGRIAAQSAKQVIIQKMKDAERDAVYASYIDRKGEVINGIVQRIDRGDIIVNIGHTEAVLPRREQVPKELYRRGDRIRAYILDILYESRGPQVILSRTHPDFLIHLFRMEVPEISEGLVNIIGAAREPGVRAKFSVSSNDSDVDPVGACVGMKGSRVQNVVQELKGEKIDIIAWHVDAAKYVCNALSPAEISRVIIDETNNMMEVIVPDDHLSIAIGKRGQNVRLASKLTGWRLDVKSEARYNETMRHGYETLVALPDVSVSLADTLYEKGFFSAEELKMATVEDLTDIRGLSEEDACQLIENADNWENFVDTTDDESDDVQDDGKISEQHDETMRPGYETLIILPNVSRDLADALYEKGFCSAEELKMAAVEDLADIRGLSEEDACQLIENADNWEHFIDNTDETDESDDDFQDDLDVEDTLVRENDVGMADESEEMTASDEHEDQKPEDADMTMPEEDVEEPDVEEPDAKESE
jgi:N utilization substance protein A